MRNEAGLRNAGLCAALCAGLLSSACGGATKSAHAELDSQVPPQLKADYASFNVHCSKCHDLDRALNAHVSDKRHWDLYVAKMMRTAGSAINKVESPKILRFLYWYTDLQKQREDADNAAKNVLPELKPEDVAPAAAAPSAGAETPAAPAVPEAPATEITSPAPATQGETAP